MEVLYRRCCGIDVHKAQLVACVREHTGARVQREVQSFGATMAEILRLHAWLIDRGCTHVAMESTGIYWRPVFNVLEGTLVVVLANAQHIKAVPGRKTDVRDCEWLADLLAHGLIRASFISPADIRELRDRVTITNRVHKLLESANIKLAAVVTDIFGVSGRAMLDALATGDTDPAALAALARGTLVRKQAALREALTGRFTAHQAFLLRQLLAHSVLSLVEN